MHDKFLKYFNNIKSNLSKEDLNEFYFLQKRDPNVTNYLLEDNYLSFCENFFKNLSDQQKKDFEELVQFNNGASGLIVFSDNFTSIFEKYKHSENGIAFLVRLYVFSEIESNIYKSTLSKELLLKKVKFSQTEIAKEFEVDNDTLSKWFELIYGNNIYFGRKQITLEEYLMVFKDLFLEPNEDFNLDENFDKFRRRVLVGKTYTKKDIIDFGFELDEEPKNNHFLEASKILNEKFSFYDRYDKYPYSIAIQLINFLKTN